MEVMVMADPGMEHYKIDGERVETLEERLEALGGQVVDVARLSAALESADDGVSIAKDGVRISKELLARAMTVMADARITEENASQNLILEFTQLFAGLDANEDPRAVRRLVDEWLAFEYGTFEFGGFVHTAQTQRSLDVFTRLMDTSEEPVLVTNARARSHTFRGVGVFYTSKKQKLTMPNGDIEHLQVTFPQLVGNDKDDRGFPAIRVTELGSHLVAGRESIVDFFKEYKPRVAEDSYGGLSYAAAVLDNLAMRDAISTLRLEEDCEAAVDSIDKIVRDYVERIFGVGSGEPKLLTRPNTERGDDLFQDITALRFILARPDLKSMVYGLASQKVILYAPFKDDILRLLAVCGRKDSTNMNDPTFDELKAMYDELLSWEQDKKV